jgi:hypothetical protein
VIRCAHTARGPRRTACISSAQACRLWTSEFGRSGIINHMGNFKQ